MVSEDADCLPWHARNWYNGATRDICGMERLPAGLDEAAWRDLERRYTARWAVALLVCAPDGRVTAGTAPAAADAVVACVARERALREALRWGQPAFELVGSELIWAVPLMRNAALCGGLVVQVPAARALGAGPYRLDARRAAAELLALAGEANVTNLAYLELRRAETGHEQHRAEAIHTLKARPSLDLRQIYLLEEPALAAAIRRGDRPEARGILNRVLVAIHHAAGERLQTVKSCYLELVTTVCRTAVYSGGAPEELLEAGLEGVARLVAIDDPVDLARWLREVLEQAMDAVQAAAEADSAAQLVRAATWLQEHFAEDLTRDEVARVACLSPAHFSREFHRRFGRTFTEALAQLRLDHATELLRRTTKPVGLVALECGYGDQSYFTRVFRRATGVTPRQYRRSFQTATAAAPDQPAR